MKKIFLFLFVSVVLISCDTTTKNQTDKNDPMSGYMVGNDEKSDAMVKFTKAYQDNNLESVKTMINEDAIFYVNETN